MLQGSGTFFFGLAPTDAAVSLTRRMPTVDADWGRSDWGRNGLEDPLANGPPSDGFLAGRAEAGRRIAGELMTEGTIATRCSCGTRSFS